MVDAQLEYISELCAKDPVCSTRTDDLAQTFRNVMRNMPERWLFLSIDPGKVKMISFIGFDEIGIGAISDTIIAAEQGDPSGLAVASLDYDFLVGGDIWGDKLAKGASADMDLNRDYYAELDPPDSIMGSPAALSVWGPAADVWPVSFIQADLRQLQYTDVETLLVSGSIDFRSPPQYATDELLPYLNKGQPRRCPVPSDHYILRNRGRRRFADHLSPDGLHAPNEFPQVSKDCARCPGVIAVDYWLYTMDYHSSVKPPQVVSSLILNTLSL